MGNEAARDSSSSSGGGLHSYSAAAAAVLQYVLYDDDGGEGQQPRQPARRAGQTRLQLPIQPYTVLASRASGCLLDTQFPQNHPSGHPNLLSSTFLKCQFQAYNWIFSTSI